MILIDTNLLLYASFDIFEQHARARAWLGHELSAGTPIGLPWHSLLGFARVASQRRSIPRGPSVAEAWKLAQRWLDQPNVWVPLPTEKHAEILDELLTSDYVGNGLVMDVHLAALAIEHGLILCSNDDDFARFKNLRWLNPLNA